MIAELISLCGTTPRSVVVTMGWSLWDCSAMKSIQMETVCCWGVFSVLYSGCDCVRLRTTFNTEASKRIIKLVNFVGFFYSRH